MPPKSKKQFNDIDRVPPQNIEAEQSVLGALMLSKEAIDKIADIVKPRDFYRGIHQTIYETMLELYEKREPIDVLSLSSKLNEKEKLEEIGGHGYLSTLVNSVPTAAHIAHYAKIVQRKSILRNVINAAYNITEMSYNENDDVDQLLDEAEQQIFQISQKSTRQSFISVKSALEEAFERIDKLHKEGGALRGISTGFSDLDNYLGGLQKSDLIILAARPSLGKTTLAFDIARHASLKEKAPVGVFSLEMSHDQLIDRLIAAQAGVDLWRMRTGRLSNEGEDNDFTKIQEAMGILSEAPIFIDDSASSNVLQMRTMARRLQGEYGLGLLVIDYLQLMQGTGRSEGRTQEVSEISRSLKNLARELNVPILAISQLSRAPEARPDQMPRLSDLRESGSIEQDADVVLFIYREDRVKKETERKNIADIFIAKHRNGPTGKVELYFDENRVSFRNLEKYYTE